ncbi:MAG: hypothetical protein FWD41_04765, partial [Actinomycetia bacterium]|nr:hypothetical protein [Actinomycetes bacterium]
MIATVTSAVLSGIDAIPIEVQVQVAQGLPSFQIVGMPDTAVAESKERVRAAFKSTGLKVPAQRVTVNLAPAHVRKIGSGLDLPIALALMVAAGYIEQTLLDPFLVVGELSLSGTVRCSPGVVSISILAALLDKSLLCGPLGEIARIIETEKTTIRSLESFMAEGPVTTQPEEESHVIALEREDDEYLDFEEVVNQESAIRALSIA